MATANSSAFTLQEESGRSYVTLTSYAGPITWSTTPVSGDQIEFPDLITVDVDGTITGASGTHTVRHIIATTGAVQAVQYILSAGQSAQATVTLDTDTGDALEYVTLTSFSGPMAFPTTPVAGDQIVFPSSCNVGVDGSFTGANATFTLTHIVASTGVSESISYTHSGANTPPSLPTLSDKIVNVGDIDSFSIGASDPDSGDTIAYSATPLPTNVELSGATLRTIGHPAGSGYTTVETVETVVTAQDDSGDTGNDSDTTTIVFAVFPSGYTGTILTVDEATINPDSPLIDAITSNDISVGDIVDYPTTVDGRAVSFSSDGLLTVAGTRSFKLDNIFYRDKSNSYSRDGPFYVKQKGTGPLLTSAFEVVPNSATTSGGQLRFTSDEGSEVSGASGSYNVIVIPSGFGTPTPAQVMAGLGPDGNAPLFTADTGGTPTQAATVEEVVTVTGLPTQGSGYWCFLALEDQYGGITLDGPLVLTTVSSGTPPVWSNVPDQVFNENANPNFDLSAYVSDFVSISLSWSPALSGSTGTTFNSATGLLGGTVNTSDAAGAPGVTTTHTVTATATNATGSSNTTFDVGFYRLNPPVVGTLANQSWQEGQAVNFGLGTAITGATSYELEIDNSGFSDGTAELSGYGLTFNSSTGVVSGTINNTMPGNSPFSMRARGLNADGNSAWIPFTVIANPDDGAGFFGPIPNQSFDEGTSGSFNASSYFTNAESYAISGLPAGTGISIDANTGVVTVNATSADAAQGTINAIITAVNGSGNAQGIVTITIVPLSPPVLIAAFPNIVAAVGDSFSITPINNFTGADSVEVIGRPTGSGLTFDGTTYSGSFASADKLASPYPITMRAINGDGNRDNTFLIEVTGAEFTDGTIITPAHRTIYVGRVRSLSPKRFSQDFTDRLDYAIDLAEWLGSDTIDSANVASGDNLVVEGIKSSTAIQVFITGGVVDTSDTITARVTTTNGRIIDVSFYVAFYDI